MTGIFQTAVSGMSAAVTRLANAAQNIANVSSTGKRASGAEPTTAFTPQDVVTLSQDEAGNALGVTTRTHARTPATTPMFDPSSPDADAQGLVAAPNVDLATEILTAQEASVTYAANAKIVAAARKNAQTLLDRLS